MDNYEFKKYIKLILLLIAIFVAGLTVFFSNKLALEIAKEEKKKIEIWAEAEKMVNNIETEGDLTFYLDIIKSNTTIPALIVDENGNIIAHRNLNEKKTSNPSYLISQLNEFAEIHTPILVPVDEKINHKVFYGESALLKKIRFYPIYALCLVTLFVAVSYFAFSYSRRAEENRVWVGLAKETAHQLGTPISSLMGWIQYLEVLENNEIADSIPEMNKDIDRLKIITERFSKIGSEPELSPLQLNLAVSEIFYYLESRFGNNVNMHLQLSNINPLVLLNKNLFQWVIENLVKNSLDAMDGKGELRITSHIKQGKVNMDISDTGHGIPSNKFKQIFKPGYTTKKRGWGLGLSLAYRIITKYHKGEIKVLQSTPNKKTTIRISLKTL